MKNYNLFKELALSDDWKQFQDRVIRNCNKEFTGVKENYLEVLKEELECKKLKKRLEVQFLNKFHRLFKEWTDGEIRRRTQEEFENKQKADSQRLLNIAKNKGFNTTAEMLHAGANAIDSIGGACVLALTESSEE